MGGDDWESIRGAIRDNGWLQGCFIDDKKLIAEICDQDVGETTLLIVVSQTCDLLNGSFSRAGEPYAQCLALKPIKAADGRRKFMKNPRFLHFKCADAANSKQWFEACIHDCLSFERRKLLDHTPSNNWSIDTTDLEMLKDWLARRYTRPPLPDDFNDSISKPTDKKLSKAVSELIGKVDDIFIRLQPDVDCENGPYEVELLIGVRTLGEGDVMAAEETGRKIAELLKTLPIVDGEVMVETKRIDEITFGDVIEFVRWDFDRVSYSGS